LEVRDIKLDGFFLVIQVQTRVSKTFNFINLGVFGELGVEVLIIVVVLLLGLFLLGIFVAVLVTLRVFLLYLVRSATFFGDFLIEG